MIYSNRYLVLFLILFLTNSQAYAIQDHENSLADDFILYSNNEALTTPLVSMKFVPLGELMSAVPTECHPLKYTHDILNKNYSPVQFATYANNYFTHCNSFLQKGNTQGLKGLLQFGKVSYNLAENPRIKKYLHTLSDGSKIETFIGLKDSINKRPWVILKCGVFCDIYKSAASLSFIINLFDQSPFNIILLSNYTGQKYVQSNTSLKIGGYYESYDYFDVARWLRSESPYKDTIDSIHAVGFSLGGSASLGVSYLYSFFNSQYGPNLINSSIAICPVVNLQPTLNDLFSNSLKGNFYATLTWKKLMEVAPFLNKATDYLSRKLPPKAQLFPEMLANISLRYGKEWDANHPPGRTAPSLETLEDFYTNNDFSSYLNEPELPTFVWASMDDSVVKYDLNTKTLLDSPRHASTLGVLGLERGNHCGFDTAYGYTVTTAVLQSFIINNSPTFKEKAKTHIVPISFLSQIAFSTSETHLKQWWVAKENSDQLELYFETFDPSIHPEKKKINCISALPLFSEPQCRRVHKQLVPVAFLSELSIQIPQNSTQAEILSRELNGLLRLTHDTQPIDETNLPPTHLTWTSY